MDAVVYTPSTEAQQRRGELERRLQGGAWGARKQNGLSLPEAIATSRTAGQEMRGAHFPKLNLIWKSTLPIDKTWHRCCPLSPPVVSTGHVASMLA